MKVLCKIIKYNSDNKEIPPFSTEQDPFYSFRVLRVEGDNYYTLAESPIVKRESGIRNYSFAGITWGFDGDSELLFIHNTEINL